MLSVSVSFLKLGELTKEKKNNNLIGEIDVWMLWSKLIILVYKYIHFREKIFNILVAVIFLFSILIHSLMLGQLLTHNFAYWV